MGSVLMGIHKFSPYEEVYYYVEAVFRIGITV